LLTRARACAQAYWATAAATEGGAAALRWAHVAARVGLDRVECTNVSTRLRHTWHARHGADDAAGGGAGAAGAAGAARGPKQEEAEGGGAAAAAVAAAAAAPALAPALAPAFAPALAPPPVGGSGGGVKLEEDAYV
jgi:hypothetical protein